MRNDEIANLYKSGLSSVELADRYNITPRQVQRILKRLGLIRTQRESFLLAIERGRMVYHKLSEIGAEDYKRSRLPTRLRYDILERDKFSCVLCGQTPPNVKLEVDHINLNATDNRQDNLRTLCHLCNHARRRPKRVTNSKSLGDSS